VELCCGASYSNSRYSSCYVAYKRAAAQLNHRHSDELHSSVLALSPFRFIIKASHFLMKQEELILYINKENKKTKFMYKNKKEKKETEKD
jgi:hypothetical protein